MCDYSLHYVTSRPAKVGDKLVSTRFSNSTTRGFAAIGQPDVAVCLLPGTEVAFEGQVSYEYGPSATSTQGLTETVARFRQINKDKPNMHHDAVEFPNGQIVLVNDLREGQRVTVLQLPPSAGTAKEEADHQEQEPASIIA